VKQSRKALTQECQGSREVPAQDEEQHALVVHQPHVAPVRDVVNWKRQEEEIAPAANCQYF